MGARLVEIDSKVHQPSDSQATQQMPSFYEPDFRNNLMYLPKDTQANDLPELKLDEYDYKPQHPADKQGPQGGLKSPPESPVYDYRANHPAEKTGEQKPQPEYDYRSQHPNDSSTKNDAIKLPDVQINNNHHDYDAKVRRPADSLPNLEIVE